VPASCDLAARLETAALLFVLGALVSGALGVVFPLSLLAFLVLVQTVCVRKKAQQIALARQKL
jgi:hypothetical protein